LAQRAGLPMPRVYLMDSPQPNAFATGRNPQNAAVCATTGLLNTLSRDEIAGVIGHELGHVRNHDTLTMTITATIAGAISMLAQFGMFFRGGNRDNNGLGVVGSVLMLILAPLAAMIVQMAISRTREYAADNLGARIIGYSGDVGRGVTEVGPLVIRGAVAALDFANRSAVPLWSRRLSIAERQGAADAGASPLVSASLGRGMRATGGGVKLARRCNSSHRICQMRPHRKPSTSAAKIAKTITNVTVIEYILRARPPACRARGYRILSPGLA
jgi:hypothetical protein